MKTQKTLQVVRGHPKNDWYDSDDDDDDDGSADENGGDDETMVMMSDEDDDETMMTILMMCYRFDIISACRCRISYIDGIACNPEC